MFDAIRRTIQIAESNVDGAVREYDVIFENARKELEQAQRFCGAVYKDLCSSYSFEEADSIIKEF